MVTDQVQHIQEAEMARPDFSEARWRKSSVSGDGGCVEVAYAQGRIGVRDTKDNGTGPVLTFTEQEWSAFLAGAQGGEFGIQALAE